MSSIPLFKRCTKCKEELPATFEYFYKDSRGRSGLSAQCKRCMKAHRWVYEKVRIQQTREINKRASKKYREAHPDRFKENQRRFTENNPERRREIGRNWWKKHPEHRRVNKMQRRALECGATGKTSKKEIDAIYKQQKGKCWWCGKSVKKEWHIDHRIPLSKGGTNDASNLVISCPKCNLRKNSKLPHEFNGRLI